MSVNRASIFVSTGLVLSGLVLSLTSSLYGQTPGEFEVRFDTSGLTMSQENALLPSLNASANFWESVITGYQPGVTSLDGIDLAVSVSDLDGPLGIIAQAGPSGYQFEQAGFYFLTDFDGTTGVPFDGTTGVPVSLTGTVTIDTDDFNTDLIVDVLNHEVAHTLGFIDELIDLNELVTTDGQFIGAEGLAAYQAEFDSTATFVPLTFGGPLPPGEDDRNDHLPEEETLVDEFGRVLADELLTPIVENTTNFDDPTSNFLSNTSAGIFRDLGFIAVAPAFSGAATATPEPSTSMILALAGMALATTRRRIAL